MNALVLSLLALLLTTQSGLTWVSVDAGEVFVHSDQAGPSSISVRRVAALEVLRTEVTVAQYTRCVQQGGCTAPRAFSASTSADRRFNFQAPRRETHPVNGVTWAQSRSFCRWLGGRLPTQLEWSRVAQLDGAPLRIGGSAWPRELLANVFVRGRVESPSNARRGGAGTYPVGSFPLGRSSAGLLDVVGNVWEWTADSSARETASDRLPQLRKKGNPRIAMGASFETPAARASSSSRYEVDAQYQLDSVGIRCVRTPPSSPR